MGVRRLLFPLSVLAALALGAVTASTPPPSAVAAVQAGTAATIKTELARLERVVRAKPANDPDWKDDRPELLESLAQVRAALAAGRLYAGLEQMEQARVALRALEVRNAGARSGMPGFEAAWKKAQAALTAPGSRDRAAPASLRGEPATAAIAARALAETAEGKTLALLEASRPYASSTGAASGFYYLGEAEGEAESRAFCSRLRPPRSAPPLRLRSVAPEIRHLQQQALDAFKPPRSIERHGDFITLNATLKLARELDASGRHAGALYQYLDALQQWARLDLPVPDAAQRAALPGTLAALAARLRRSGQDDSLGELFLERAEGLLAGRPSSAPTPDDWRNAAVLAGQVLPAYFSTQGALGAQAAQQTAAPESAPATGHPVTVTLVRWPYT